MRLAGLLVLALHGLRYVRETPALRPYLLLLCGAAAALVLAVSAVPLSEVTRARLKEALNRLERLVVVAMVVLMAGSIGVYQWVDRIAG